MSRSAKFRSKAEFNVGDVIVHIGRRSAGTAAKLIINPDCSIIVDLNTAMDLADTLDEAITAYEDDPLLWQ